MDERLGERINLIEHRLTNAGKDPNDRASSGYRLIGNTVRHLSYLLPRHPRLTLAGQDIAQHDRTRHVEQQVRNQVKTRPNAPARWRCLLRPSNLITIAP